MSFLFQQSERPPKRRKKYDGGNSKSTEKDEISSKPYDNLIVIGYQSKIFRDDLVAKYIEDGKHLITWMGDESLLVDRYDCRGYFHSRDDFGLPTDDNTDLSQDDKQIEAECDEFRYYGLSLNKEDHDSIKEESNDLDTTSPKISAPYSNLNYDYHDEHVKEGDGDKEYDPNECFDSDDSNLEIEVKKPVDIPTEQVQTSHIFVQANTQLQTLYKKPDGLDIPEGMEVPDSQKSQSIIEKTALFISRHGTQMEIILKARQSGNPQFDFLNFGNWLNPYYKLILAKIKEGTYEVNEALNENNDDEQKEDSKDDSESESDSNDEYIHPLLQAHRRPVKTQAETSSEQENARKARVGTSSYKADVKTSSSMVDPLSDRPYANAAEIYMARKYEHLRKDKIKKSLEANDDNRNTEENWADQLEEDKNFLFFDSHHSSVGQIDKQFDYGMLQFMHPPPPPPSSSSSSSLASSSKSALLQGHSTQLTHVVPTQPLPPGDNSSIEKPFMSHDNPHHLPQQQQQLDHIVPPPPDFKSVVDKLAEYVARNGEVFEEQIKRKNDPRFEFLNVQNIYFPYYLYKKQQCIMEIKSKETPRDKDVPEKTVKPLSFSLKKKTAKASESKLPSVEIFKSIHDDCDSDLEEEIKDNFDGYRPNKVKQDSKKRDQTMEEKAKETMEKAKAIIAEAQRKQKELQQNVGRGQIDPEVQMERRRKAAAFIGMLKKANKKEITSSSSESSSDEEDGHRSEEDEEDNSLPKRHFKEN